MYKLILIIVLTSIYSVIVSAQNTDSLYQETIKLEDNFDKLQKLMKLSKKYKKENSEKTLKVLSIAEELSVEIKESKYLSEINGMKGTVYLDKGKLDTATIFLDIAIKQAAETHDTASLSNIHNSYGIVYTRQNNFEKAIEHYLESLRLKEAINDEKGTAFSSNNLGIMFMRNKQFEKAKYYLKNALPFLEKIEHNFGVGIVNNNLGLIAKHQDSLQLAIKHFQISEDYFNKINNRKSISMVYNNLGQIYNRQGKYETAEGYFIKALKIKKEINDIQGINIAMVNLANVFIGKNDFKTARLYADSAKSLAIQSGDKNHIIDVYYLLANIDTSLQNYKEASYNYAKVLELKDSLFNEENDTRVQEANAKYEAEKKEKEISIQKSIIEKQEIRHEKEVFVKRITFLIITLLMLLIYAVFRAYRNKKKAEEEIRQKNQNITDSINYAERIQKAILPGQTKISRYFDSFIFFKPRDIVSGDFYWFLEHNENVYLALADCTGHGVPGAFMSMIGNTLLNEIILSKNITEPAAILDELNLNVHQLLQTNEDSSKQSDGMDISLLKCNKTNNQISIAIAQQQAVLINAKNDAEIIKGSRFSIGEPRSIKKNLKFKQQIITPIKGDMLYLYSDGFPDQVGGKDKSRYSNAKMVDYFKKTASINTEEQLQKTEKEFNNWKESYKQLDDILVIGIKF